MFNWENIKIYDRNIRINHIDMNIQVNIILVLIRSL